MRALVTGGAGFVGSHVVQRLLDEGDDVLVLDDLSTGRPANLPPDVRLEEIDIADPGVGGIVTSFRPELITHCAANASVPSSMADPANDARVNIVGGVNVFQAAIESECPRFTYVTTGGALYGTPEYLPCDEDHPIRPESAYGLSKWTLESYLGLLVPSSMRLNVLRLANVYGPRQDPQGEAGVVAIFGLSMLKGETVTIHGDGEQTRDFVSAADVVEAHQLGATASEPVTVNVGSGEATSVNALFEVMAGLIGYALDPVHEAERLGDVKHVVLDSSRARELLGWEPATRLHDGLKDTLDWLRTQA